MSDIDISLTLIISPSGHYQRDSFSKRLNSRMNATCTNDWNRMFHDTLHSEFSLNLKDLYLYQRWNRTDFLCPFRAGRIVFEVNLQRQADRHEVQSSLTIDRNSNKESKSRIYTYLRQIVSNDITTL